MKTANDQRIKLEDRLAGIENEIESLASNGKGGVNGEKIRMLLDEYDRIEAEWRACDYLLNHPGETFDLYESMKIFKP